jgi:Tetracyclin repressor-like, C-terminal domain
MGGLRGFGPFGAAGGETAARSRRHAFHEWLLGKVGHVPPLVSSSVVVRIVESFLYAEIITGGQLDVAEAKQTIAALLVRD